MEQPMLQNGMPGQTPAMASMQRPQPGNLSQQIFARIINDLKSAMGQFSGTWQATLDPRIRANYIMQLTTTLNMLEPEIGKCLQIAQKFEQSSISSAQNRPQYEQAMAAKLDEIKQKRAQRATLQRPGPGNMQQQMGTNMNAQDGNMMQAQQMNNMNNGMQPLGFPTQLQRPMQPSMLQPPAQRPTTMDPSFLMNRPEVSPQFPMGMPVNNNNNNSTDMSGQQDMSQNGAASQENSVEIQQLAQHFMAQMPEAKRNELRKTLYAQMSEQQRAMYNARQGDPLKTFVIGKARQEIAKRKSQQGQGMQMLPQGQRPQQFGLGDQMNMGGLGTEQQAGSNFSSLSQLYGQQANALKMQESGEQVVPVSDNNMFGNANMLGQGQNNNLNMLGQGQKPSGEAQRQMLLQQQQQQNQKQLQDRMINQRNTMARAQALNVQQQNGNQGMSMNGNLLGVNNVSGQLGSPAMSMLNRPMPGSDNQQNFGGQGLQNFNPLAGGDAAALAQHHQSMINQNNNAGMPQAPPQAMSSQALNALLNSLPVEVRNRILSMPPLERNVMIARFKAAQDQKVAQARQAQLQASNDQQMGMANGNMNPNPVQANLMNLLPLTQQQVANPAAPQPTPEQVQRQRQQHMLRGQAMMSRPLPRHIANQLQIPIPGHVQKWGQLRQHIQVNAGTLPQDMPSRMMQAMERHFAANPADLQQGIKDVLAMHQQNAQRGGLGPGMPPQQQGLPNAMNGGQMIGQQPPNMMSAPVAPMQPVQAEVNGAPVGFVPQISKQDIAQVRMLRKIGPQVSDEQIRQALVQRKMAGMAQATNSQNNMQQNAGTNNLARPPQPPKRPGVPAAAPQATVTPKLPPGAGKRAPNSVDDVVEIPNPNQMAKKMPPAMAAQQSMMSQMPMPTPEQLARLPEEQRKRIQQQYANMQRRSQGGPQPTAPAMKPSPSMQKLSANDAQRMQLVRQQQRAHLNRLYNELGKLPPKGPPVKVEPSQVAELKTLFKKMWKPLQALEPTLATAYTHIPGFNDENAKQLLKAKHMFDLNLADEEGNIKDYLSANLVTFKQISHLVMQYYADVQKYSPKKGGLAGDMVGQPPMQGQQRPGLPAQASAASMAANKAATKANSKPPAAPVDDKKFWGGVASPHGVPKYDTQKPDLTPDQLKMPPGKKRKTGPNSSQPTTPAQTSTPTATPKLPSGKPEALVKPASKPAPPEVEKARYRCPHLDSCDASIGGFETEAQLKLHLETAHVAIENPFDLLMSTTADLLKMVQRPKAKPVASAKPKPQAVAMVKAASKQSVKGTPSKPAADAETSATKAAAEGTGDKSMSDILTTKLGFGAKSEEPTADASVKDGSPELDEIFNALGDILKPGLDDINPLGSGVSMDIDDWGLDLPDFTPPELTPGDGSDSSRDSDVSFNDQLRMNLTWDPFNTGDTSLPDFLKINDELLIAAEALATQDIDASKVSVADKASDKPVGTKDKENGKGPAQTSVAADASKLSADQWSWAEDSLDWNGLLNMEGIVDGAGNALDQTTML